jgi:hypothetical protein
VAQDFFFSGQNHALSLGDNWTDTLVTSAVGAGTNSSSVPGNNTIENDYVVTYEVPAQSDWDGTWTGQLELTAGQNKLYCEVGLCAYTTGGSLIDGPHYSDETEFEIETPGNYSLTWTSLTWDAAVGTAHHLAVRFKLRNDNHTELSVSFSHGDDATKTNGTWFIAPWTAAGDYDVTGTVSSPTITVDGDVLIGRDAAGTVISPTITVSGTATVSRSSSGTVVSPAITVSGTATIRRSASGIVASPTITVSGSASITKTASGAVTSPTIVVSGSATVSRFASGSVIVSPTVSGTATKSGTKTASGSVSLTTVTVSGVATVSRSASGTVSVAPTVSGIATTSGVVAYTASGTVAEPTITVSGSATVSRSGSGSVTAPAVTVSGTATVSRYATGSVTAPTVTVSGQAYLSFDVTGSILAPTLTVSGAVTVGRATIIRITESTIMKQWEIESLVQKTQTIESILTR